jgi:hypothetical protein
MKKETLQWIIAFIVLILIVVVADILFGKYHQ